MEDGEEDPSVAPTLAIDEIDRTRADILGDTFEVVPAEFPDVEDCRALKDTIETGIDTVDEIVVTDDCVPDATDVKEDCTPDEKLAELEFVTAPDADAVSSFELVIVLEIEDNGDGPVALPVVRNDTAPVEIEIEATTGEMTNTLEEIVVPEDCEVVVGEDCTPKEKIAELEVVEAPDTDADTVNWDELTIEVEIEVS